ncbi:Syntaxin-61 [Vitis vinifera]|uniref:Syntaxin-61 n=1 Tax=Vitis vinifera TaxID=29760 RepID=A0A438BSQ6_VITVI|nr:Syntaxin-61 [Vitis vinifera]
MLNLLMYIGEGNVIDCKMSSAQDPFYIVKEEIQESIDKLLSTFHQWERIPVETGEQVHLTKELLASCESIEWQVDELDKTISVAAKDPAWYGIDEVELDKRRRWTSTAHTQVSNVKKSVVAGKESNGMGTANVNGMRREMMRMSNPHQADRSNQYGSQDNDDFISSESDRQLLLIRRQDEELDVLSASVERIGGVGLTIHEELLAQEKIIDELGSEMDSTSNRLDFVQKKVAMVMKKASAKGQIMMILFLVVLFIVLFVLVFLT